MPEQIITSEERILKIPAPLQPRNFKERALKERALKLKREASVMLPVLIYIIAVDQSSSSAITSNSTSAETSRRKRTTAV